jgi:hypothetical protein
MGGWTILVRHDIDFPCPTTCTQLGLHNDKGEALSIIHPPVNNHTKSTDEIGTVDLVSTVQFNVCKKEID